MIFDSIVLFSPKYLAIILKSTNSELNTLFNILSNLVDISYLNLIETFLLHPS